MKKLFRVYDEYGKSSGAELIDEFVREDIRYNREDVLNKYNWSLSDVFDSDKFISGECDSVYIDLSGGDWDDPTGREIVIQSKEEAIDEAKAEYDSTLASIEDKFK